MPGPVTLLRQNDDMTGNMRDVLSPRTSANGLGRAAALLRRGRVLEGITLGWNVAGIAVLAIAAIGRGLSRWRVSAWTR